jgi:hypothetical protein
MAVPKAIASAMFGVPASNLYGNAFHSLFSNVTLLIMSPPPRKGGIASRIDSRPYNTPMPVGPYTLWPVNT